MALAGNDICHYQSIVNLLKIDKNVKYALEYSERLVFEPFLVTMIQNIDVWTHLALAGHN